jgi:hypothetical protein
MFLGNNRSSIWGVLNKWLSCPLQQLNPAKPALRLQVA